MKPDQHVKTMVRAVMIEIKQKLADFWCPFGSPEKSGIYLWRGDQPVRGEAQEASVSR